MRDSDCAGLHYKTGRAVQQHTRATWDDGPTDGFLIYFYDSQTLFFFFFFSRLFFLSKRNFFILNHHHPFNLTYFPHMWARAWWSFDPLRDRWEKKSSLYAAASVMVIETACNNSNLFFFFVVLFLSLFAVSFGGRAKNRRRWRARCEFNFFFFF
jgi:hypothetical protein